VGRKGEKAKKGPRPFALTGTLDIECAEWDRFILGVTYDGDCARVWYDGDQMVAYLLERGGTWYAHAGGVYDGLYILDRFLEKRVACQSNRSQHRVSRIVAGGLTIRDSYSLWPAPLGDLCGSIGVPEPQLPWACECGRSCGGFCRLSTISAQGEPDLEDYCKADAVCLYRALKGLAEFTADHGIELRGTLGRTAWMSAKSELGVPDSDMPPYLWRAIRQADKGGRQCVVRPRSAAGEVGAHHDICSAYPASLGKTSLPVGDPVELGAEDADQALSRGLPGVYTVSVKVPEDSFIPPLPWKKGILAFPTGEFSGTWPLPELIAAFERGVILKAVYSAIVWEAQAPVFGPLVDRWYQIRRGAGKKTPHGQWVSRLAKALCGVFAMKPDNSRDVFFPESIKVCTGRGRCRNKCTKKCGAYQPLDMWGRVWGVPYFQMPDTAYPQWSSYLRALTRVQWMTQAERMGERLSCSACGEEVARPSDFCPAHPGATISRSGGGRALCFGNTDSLWHMSRQTPEPLGDDLGEWEFQHGIYDLEVLSASTYAYRDPADDQLHVSGIPGITEEDWRRGKGILDRGIVTFGSAVKTDGGLFKAKHRKWSLPRRDRVWFGDRILQGDGLTIPATAQQLRDLVKRKEESELIREEGRSSASSISRRSAA